MDPLVAAAIVTAIGGFGTALIAKRLSNDAAEAKEEADKTTLELTGVKIQLDAWPSLYQSVVAELERSRADVREERAVAETFAARADRLQRERDEALDEAALWRQRLAALTEESDDKSDS